MLRRKVITLRAEVDAIDDQLVDLVARRARLAVEIYRLKRSGAPFPLREDPYREAEILERAARRAEVHGLEPEKAAMIVLVALEVSKEVQQKEAG